MFIVLYTCTLNISKLKHKYFGIFDTEDIKRRDGWWMKIELLTMNCSITSTKRMNRLLNLLNNSFSASHLSR